MLNREVLESSKTDHTMKGLFGYLQNKMYGPGIKGPTVEMFRTIVLGLIRSNDKMFST